MLATRNGQIGAARIAPAYYQRPRRKSIHLRGLGQANTVADFRNYVDATKQEIERRLKKPFTAAEEQEIKNWLSRTNDNVAAKYAEAISPETITLDELDELEAVLNDWQRFYFYMLGGVSADVTVKEPGFFESLREQIGALGLGLGIALAAMLAITLASKGK